MKVNLKCVLQFLALLLEFHLPQAFNRFIIFFNKRGLY
jgi:hypothetical protein